MTTPAEHRQQQALLKQLDAGSPVAQQQARELRQLYHDREMGGLSADTYASAAHRGQPPTGWLRASEHLDQLRELSPDLAKVSKEELKEMLQPGNSKFRAEIYLPDPAVLGPGYKPVVAFKGSTGPVVMANGKTGESATEDFVANNFPQSVGLKTDYYDRAMELGVRLKDANLDFESTGHSLGGGMSSACSAVTGVSSTTFNAAGLHPETARRFDREHPQVRIQDVNQTVRSYQVSGELLNDGIQNNLSSLDVIKRAELSGVLKEASELLQNSPQGREMLKQVLDDRLGKGVSPQSHATVAAFVDKLAKGDPARMIAELPLAAGRTQPALKPMTHGERGVVARPDLATLQELTHLSGPLLTVLSATAQGAHAGHVVGGGVATAGRVGDRILDGMGNGHRLAAHGVGMVHAAAPRVLGETVGAGVRAGGHTLAGARQASAEIEAAVDIAQGWTQKQAGDLGANVLRSVGGLLPSSVRQGLDAQAARLQSDGEQAQHSNNQEAAAARHQGHQDADALRQAGRETGARIARAGHRAGDAVQHGYDATGRQVDGAFDQTGRSIRGATARAPEAGATFGAAAAGGVTAAVLHTPQQLPNLYKSVTFGRQIGSAGGEALERHSMDATVLPSLDHRIDQTEATARRMLPSPAQNHDQRSSLHAPSSPAAGSVGTQFDRLFQMVMEPDERLSRQGVGAIVQDYLRGSEGQRFQQQVSQQVQNLDTQERQMAWEAQQRQLAEQAQQQEVTHRSRGMGR